MRELDTTDLRNDYVTRLSVIEDAWTPFMDRARVKAETFGKGFMSLGPWEAQNLAWILAERNFQKFVEIGTLTGHSALWILKSLGVHGHLWTFEKDPVLAGEVQKLFADLQNDYLSKQESSSPDFGKKVSVVVGDALETLPTIQAQGPFDGIFIDGNKLAYPKYLDWAEKNIRSGGLIIADNIFLGGSVFDPSSDKKFSEKQIQAMRDFNQRLFDKHKYNSTILPTGEGLLLAWKL